jgi:hypothetical protein
MPRTKEHGPPDGPPPPEVPTKTGGGGDDDNDSLREAIARMAAQAVEQAVGSRKEFVTSSTFVLVPDTLVGSWFHRLENDDGYDWRFYDTEEQAQNAFARSLSTRKE